MRLKEDYVIETSERKLFIKPIALVGSLVIIVRMWFLVRAASSFDGKAWSFLTAKLGGAWQEILWVVVLQHKKHCG